MRSRVSFPDTPRCPSPIIFCDCRGPCSQNPDIPPLPQSKRVVTHSPMLERIDKTRLLMVVAAVGAFFLYVQHENAEAVRSMDYSRCWTDSCKSDISSRWR